MQLIANDLHTQNHSTTFFSHSTSIATGANSDMKSGHNSHTRAQGKRAFLWTGTQILHKISIIRIQCGCDLMAEKEHVIKYINRF